MEFFDWMGIPQIFMEYFFQGSNALDESIRMLLRANYIIIGVAAGLYLFCLIMGGFGLMEMCKRAGVKHGWLGFLPFGNTYLSGKLAGETYLFGKKMKRVGLYAMIVEIAFVALNIAALVLDLIVQSNPAYYAEQYSYAADGTEQLFLGWGLETGLVPAGMIVSATVLQALSLVSNVLMLFFFCVLYFAFFRRYYARSPYLMTFLCAILPVRGFVLFAVRKNTPVDYNAYYRAYMERMRQQQAQYRGDYDPYDDSRPNGPNPYSGGGNPYSGYGNPYSGSGNPNSGSPFSDFGSDGNSPFSDFDSPRTPNPPGSSNGNPASGNSGSGNSGSGSPNGSSNGSANGTSNGNSYGGGSPNGTPDSSPKSLGDGSNSASGSSHSGGNSGNGNPTNGSSNNSPFDDF